MATEKEMRWDNQSVTGNLKDIKESMNTIMEGIEFLKTNASANTIATAVKNENVNIPLVEEDIIKEENVTPIESIVNSNDKMIEEVQNEINKPLYTIVDKEIFNAFMENGLARSMSFSSDQIKNLGTAKGMIK